MARWGVEGAWRVRCGAVWCGSIRREVILVYTAHCCLAYVALHLASVGGKQPSFVGSDDLMFW